MSGLVFELTPPPKKTASGEGSVLDYIRDPAMLSHLREKSETTLTKEAQNMLRLIPIRAASDSSSPSYVASTEPLNENGKLLIHIPEHKPKIGELIASSKVCYIESGVNISVD